MIIYSDRLNTITPDHLNGFFEGWSNPPSNEIHFEVLINSSHVVLAIDEETECVIGFINAISDKILSAYIPLLEVLPSYRGKGIGRELVKRMLDLLNEYYMVDLTCDEELYSFYERTGLVPSCGMMKRNYHRQSGIK